MVDAYYLQNQIQLEITNLERDHVYYSIDEQPEVCARLIAQGLRGSKSSENIKDDMADGVEQIKEAIAEKMQPAFTEAINAFADFGHRVSVTVQGWHDVEAAIRLIRERQREFKRGRGL